MIFLLGVQSCLAVQEVQGSNPGGPTKFLLALPAHSHNLKRRIRLCCYSRASTTSCPARARRCASVSSSPNHQRRGLTGTALKTNETMRQLADRHKSRTRLRSRYAPINTPQRPATKPPSVASDSDKTAFCSHRRFPRRYPYTLAYSPQRPNRRSRPPAANRVSISDKLSGRPPVPPATISQ